MTPTKEEIITFLSQRPMFSGIEETELARIADRLDPFTLEAGKPVFAHGDRGSVFYLLYTGKVRMWRSQQKQEIELGELESGDLFGEEALLFTRPRPYSINTVEDSFFLTLHKADFNWMVNRFPQIKSYLEVIAHTRQQARSLEFDWLQRGEVVYLMTRRHPAELVIDLFRPLVALLVAGIFFYFSTLVGVMDSLKYLSYFVAIPLVALAVLWSIWEVIDWQNDYFFITSQRVVWLEQVILQSASRQEAPLAAIQSVDVSTSQIGRIFGFGDVFVRTFTGTGSLTLTSIDQPKRFKKEIEELLIRVRQKQAETADERVRQSIRQSLGLESAELEDPVLQVVQPEQTPTGGFLKTREVQGDTITYHKHWWLLFAKTWLWIFALLATIVFIFYLGFNQFAFMNISFPVTSTLFFSILAVFIFLGGIGYHYIDWKNDIYQLTGEMLIDSEKKPLGREVSRSAPLKNIISLEHERKGILHLILNFGEVRVVVADEQLIFYDVGNPALIQQDIYYRLEQLKLQEEEQEMEKDRAHITKWLKTYHEVIQSEDQPPSEES
jgi:uncharacterized membrane protein YdbT with pleckstrin-like domain